jgi:hypothetical protein
MQIASGARGFRIATSHAVDDSLSISRHLVRIAYFLFTLICILPTSAEKLAVYEGLFQKLSTMLVKVR